MDTLVEHYSDSLSYIDNEYDNPVVKSYVDSLIKSEMSTFPNDYLARLPTLPKFKYAHASAATARDMDMKRYEVHAPEAPMDKNIQSWRSAISNAKSQIENQSNRLLNLEISEKNSPAVWLQYNNIMELSEKSFLKRNEDIFNEINAINFDRKETQENVKAELDKILRRRDESILKSWQIENSCNHMENSIASMRKKSNGATGTTDVQNNKRAKLDS